MDHAEARERLELASLQPRRLDQLLRPGDPQDPELAVHLAGCQSCSAELRALRAVREIAADVVQTTPVPELRARTLDYVAAVGRPRDGRQSRTSPWRLRWPSIAWGGAIFAAGAAAVTLVLAMMLGQAQADVRTADAAIAEQQRAIAGLTSVADWTMRLATDGDAETVRLSSPKGTGQLATVVYSAQAGEMVMVASGLPPPPPDQEYRCWFDADGSRHLVGKMYVAGDLAYWTGRADNLPSIAGRPTFGVSLVPATSTGVEGGDTVLLGSS